MPEIRVQQPEAPNDEISLKDLIIKIGEWVSYLKTKWLVIFLAGVFGASVGFMYAYQQKPVYTAILSFALEDEKSGGGLSGAMGLASSLGIDLGTGAGGAFSGANLIELMKSRTLVEKALLNPITINNKQQSLASYFIDFNQLNESWDEKPELKNISFEPLSDRTTYTLQQDSILGKLYETIVGGALSVSLKDKKASILNIQVKTTNELFSKAFTESIAKVVSEFYIEIKSKKAKLNISILQRQADSMRNELNAAITGVARANDNTYNLNPALNINRTPSAQKQIDVQANTAMLTQLVANLEMAKVTLLKETPLIQVIDKPILPLKKEKVGKLNSLIFGGFLAGFLVVLGLIASRVFRNIFI